MSAPEDIDADAIGRRAWEDAYPDEGITWDSVGPHTRAQWCRIAMSGYRDGRASRNADLDAAYRAAGVHMLASMRMRERALAAESALAHARATIDSLTRGKS